MGAPSWIQWLVLAGAGAVVADPGRPSAKELPQPAQAPRAEGSSRLERPDDLAGVPAPRAPGPTRHAVVVQQAMFASFQVNVDSSGGNILGDAANEPSIAVDPNDPNRLAIGWRQFDTVTSNFRQAGFGYSQDGGRTWTFPGVLEPGVFRSDPVLASDASGTFYYNSLKVVGSSYLCDVYKSTDHGVSWGSSAPAYGGDKAWMTVDRTTSPGAGHVYSSWSVFAGCCGNNTFTRSTDAAQTFSVPLPIPNEPIWGTLDVAADGTLFIGGHTSQSFSMFVAARSSNARNAAVTPSFDLSTLVDLGGPLVYFQGLGTPNPEGLLGQVSLAVDRSSGPTAGYVYMLSSVDPPGPDPLDVHFVRSTDHGATWSTPVTVNNDPPSAGSWQWFGTLSVAPDGRIDVVWNDTRNTGQPNLCELYGSSSTDGGVTWSTNQALTPVWDSHIGWPNQQKIGDYYHMVSDRVGADLAFAATFNGEQDVFYLRIGDHDCNQNGVADALDISSGTSNDANANGIPDECETSVGTPFCFGDGSGTACPCGNTGASGNGCANSVFAGGAGLSSIGTQSVSADSLVLLGAGMSNGSALYFQGTTQQSGGLGSVFGDGLRCAGGTTIRLSTKTNANGASHYPETGDPSVSGRGMVLVPGVRTYQVWYRNAGAFCTSDTFNLTNGLSVTWGPWLRQAKPVRGGSWCRDVKPR